jgi:protein subunit release factor B
MPQKKINIMSLASQIRKKGEDWQDAIKRATKQVSSVASKNTAGSKARTGYKQTGTVKSVSLDKQRVAKKAGRRVSASGKLYTETRANRSDKGKLYGLEKSLIPINTVSTELHNLEFEIKRLKAQNSSKNTRQIKVLCDNFIILKKYLNSRLKFI